MILYFNIGIRAALVPRSCFGRRENQKKRTPPRNPKARSKVKRKRQGKRTHRWPSGSLAKCAAVAGRASSSRPRCASASRGIWEKNTPLTGQSEPPQPYRSTAARSPRGERATGEGDGDGERRKRRGKGGLERCGGRHRRLQLAVGHRGPPEPYPKQIGGGGEERRVKGEMT